MSLCSFGIGALTGPVSKLLAIVALCLLLLFSNAQFLRWLAFRGAAAISATAAGAAAAADCTMTTTASCIAVIGLDICFLLLCIRCLLQIFFLEASQDHGHGLRCLRYRIQSLF